MEPFFVIQNAASVLEKISVPGAEIDLGRSEIIDAWGLVALSALAYQRQLRVFLDGSGGAGAFAKGLGFEEVLRGQDVTSRAEARTVKLRRVVNSHEINAVSKAISRLIVSDVEASISDQDSIDETQKTLEYVIVELLRNAIQHGGSPGFVAAQRMDQRNQYPHPVVQVAVADAGVGIPAALAVNHSDIEDPRVALERSLHPHISGTFPAGGSGGIENAGMGLFFTSEFAKRTAGRLLIATRGATLQLLGDESGEGNHNLSFLKPAGTGYPGTLVGFELRLGEVRDYESLLATVRLAASDRSPRRLPQRWLRFDAPPANAQKMLVSVAAEDTAAAVDYAARVLTPRILKKVPLVLDFRGQELFTQSYVHSLLYEPLRIAWALRTPLYIVNAAPAVRSSLEFLESYALELGAGTGSPQ
jgi:anti-sigma regulatory factor (Ser/Thr protein kinase)